jgi:ribonuclease D
MPTAPGKHRAAHYIQHEAGLKELSARLRDSDRLAIDTEFMGEESYAPRLEILQVATEDVLAIVDRRAVGTLESFLEALTNPRVLKIVHAGRQDLEIFSMETGAMPTPVFDTQVAAAMVGYGHQIGYAQLVRQVLGVSLEKTETFTNWAQRPLTPEQIEYAADDVRYLFALHAHLEQRLKALGRLEWTEEEFRLLQAVSGEEARAPHLRYQRIRGWEGLKPRARGVLRELAIWREQEAQRHNRPRGRILRDEILLEIARRSPTTIDRLRGLRGLQSSQVEKYAEALVAAVERGLKILDRDLPHAEKRPRIDPESAGLADLLGTALKVRAVEASISPQLLASAADLELFALERGRGQAQKLPIMQGWRRELAGEHLLKVLEGKLGVGYDSNIGQVRLFER